MGDTNPNYNSVHMCYVYLNKCYQFVYLFIFLLDLCDKMQIPKKHLYKDFPELESNKHSLSKTTLSALTMV